MVNCNEETGIPFGIISSTELHQEVVEELLYEQGFDYSYANAVIELVKEHDFSEEDKAYFRDSKGIDLENINWANSTGEDNLLADYIIDVLDFDGDRLNKKRESIDIEEPYVVGEYEGVKYETSWLGGALNFVIISSPNITGKAHQGSPCVPNMGVLDTLDGDYQCYDVPAEWRDNGDD